jgi:hypothetical protein
MVLRLFRGLVAVLLVAMVAAALARADGDPASDVLLNQNVFYPYSPPVSTTLQGALNAETAMASRNGAPIKVALIASRLDLGAVPALFEKPQEYADFLEQEIVLVQRQQEPLLVVMPAGYGVVGVSAAAPRAIAGLPGPASGQSDDLARAAMTAVAKLATATGHPIATPAAAATAPTGSAQAGGSFPVLVVALVAVGAGAAAATVLVRRRRASPPDPD